MMNLNYTTVVVLDTIEDKITQQSLELIAFADSYNSGDLSRTLIVVPGRNVFELCRSMSIKNVIDIIALEDEELYYPNPELLAELLAGVISEYNPEIIVLTHTVRNCQSAAKLSVLLKCSTVTAVESFTGDSGDYIFQRSILNGKLKVNLRLETPLKIVTVLSGAYTLNENMIPYNNEARLGSSPASTNTVLIATKSSIAQKAPAPRPLAKKSDAAAYRPVSISSEKESGVKLEDADVIISAGRGIGKEENLVLIKETASIFTNSAIGASRPICDQRWIPFNQQVGVTGKTVSPKLYMACGISGSQQHIAGMKNSRCIVAINKDPNASIFSIADYCIIEDIVTFLPVLVRKYRERCE